MTRRVKAEYKRQRKEAAQKRQPRRRALSLNPHISRTNKPVLRQSGNRGVDQIVKHDQGRLNNSLYPQADQRNSVFEIGMVLSPRSTLRELSFALDRKQQHQQQSRRPPGPDRMANTKQATGRMRRASVASRKLSAVALNDNNGVPPTSKKTRSRRQTITHMQVLPYKLQDNDVVDSGPQRAQNRAQRAHERPKIDTALCRLGTQTQASAGQTLLLSPQWNSARISGSSYCKQPQSAPLAPPSPSLSQHSNTSHTTVSM